MKANNKLLSKRFSFMMKFLFWFVVKKKRVHFNKKGIDFYKLVYPPQKIIKIPLQAGQDIHCYQLDARRRFSLCSMYTRF